MAFLEPSARGGSDAVWKMGLAALSLAVIGVGVWMLLAILGDDQSSSGRRARQSLSFKCDSCGHEFRQSPKEFSDQAKKQTLDMSRLGLANCPACGGKQVGRQMVRCVSCSRFFVPGPLPSTGGKPRFACPYCRSEFDLNQLMDASRRSER